MKNQGRILEISQDRIVLQSEKGTQTFSVKNPDSASPGDLVEITKDRLILLTPNRTSSRTTKWMNRILDPRRKKGIQTRSEVEKGIRDFFHSKGFLETRTPLLVPCPGMETHIRPFSVTRTDSARKTFLPTSPEFAMKRLLVGGLEKIFQICSSFRDEPNSPHHRPEFTMLEWYRAYAGYEEIMKDTEELYESLAMKFFGEPFINYQGKKISVKTPWPRLRVRDLFLEKSGVDLVKNPKTSDLVRECQRLKLPWNSEDTWDDLYFKIWLNLIEPNLPEEQAVFVLRYPPSQAALAVVDQDPDGTSWAKRFEIYAAGLELGNAFEELTDPIDQRRRFVEDMDLREKIYGPSFPKNPIDEDFLEALTEGMPPSGGIAVGVDRMVMLFANEPDIDYTFWIS